MALLEFEELSHAKILVIGVGGGGGNAVNTMIAGNLDGVEFIAANTDLQALQANLAPTKIQLGDHLILGRGEEKTGGRFKQALLADGYEALIAAIYLDGGLEAAGAFLRREFKEVIDSGIAQTVAPDHKSELQERVQALGRPLPEYRVSGAEGPDHRKTFTIEVVVNGEVLGVATGRAKKEAEQEAARLALAKLKSA